jgi:UDP-glucose 4-epimerase
MDIRGKKFVLVGGAGLIGSHTADWLAEEDVKEIVIYDNFTRGRVENLAGVLKDPRARIYDIGGDILQSDILQSAFEGADGVFHFAALWLLQCHEYPRSAFDVNVRGTFNVLEACVAKKVKRLIYSSSASVYGDAVEEPMSEDHPFNNRNFYGATKIAGEAMATAYCYRYGLPVAGLRYMNVYGPRQGHRGLLDLHRPAADRRCRLVARPLDAQDQGRSAKTHRHQGRSRGRKHRCVIARRSGAAVPTLPPLQEGGRQ